MKWPWKRKPSDAEAARHRDAAAERLQEATDRWPEVRELARWSRDRRHANHLTELFYKMQEERP